MARNPNGKGGGSNPGEVSLSQYKKEYCQQLIDHMSLGYSFTSFGADVNCSARTLHNWCKDFPEFEEAKLTGQQKAKKFFEKLARMKMIGQKQSLPNGEVLDPKRSDTAMIIFFLKTRFRDEYTEKVDIESTNRNIVINFKEKEVENPS